MITAIDKNSALILIDLQKGIVKMELAHPVEPVLQNAATLAHAFREKGLPIILVNVNPFGAPWTRTRVQQTAPSGSSPNPEFYELVPGLNMAKSDLLITKRTWNAFYETGLQEELEKRKITGIVLAGIATSIGVEGTARAASEKGYNISFASDAITDRILSAHQNSLQVIFPRIGELGTTEEILSNLNPPA